MKISLRFTDSQSALPRCGAATKFVMRDIPRLQRKRRAGDRDGGRGGEGEAEGPYRSCVVYFSVQ